MISAISFFSRSSKEVSESILIISSGVIIFNNRPFLISIIIITYFC
nr:MAG TPA: hypothetical protein [Caudoviricetes sp.]